MQKIITAITNPELNEELKKNNYNVIAPDIQYQEGVIEILEKKQEINILYLSENLLGELNLFNLINKIKKINNNLKIIIILENENEEKSNFLISKGIYDIFYNNKTTKKELINCLEKSNNPLEKEIQELRQMIIEKNENNKNKFLTKIKTLKNNKKINEITNKEKTLNNKCKIINIIGPSGIGKTSITILISKMCRHKNILLIDFDIEKNDLKTVLGMKKLNDTQQIKIKKINNKIDLIYINKENSKNIKNEIMNNFINKYDYIFIDFNLNNNENIFKEIINISTKNIFITGINLLELKKAKIILNIIINNFKINKNKINIIFNKYSNNLISEKILKQLFSDFNILGKINLNSNYNLLINSNAKIIDKEIKKEMLKIINKLENKKEDSNEYKFTRIIRKIRNKQ